MNGLDLKVLDRIGCQGAELAQIIEVAEGDYDIDSLIRTGYVRLRRESLVETTGSRVRRDEDVTSYVLTPKGAETISLDPSLLD
jgi:hypothetical protein